MKFSGNIDIETRNTLLHFGDVPDSGGQLTFESSKDQNQGALFENRFDHKATGTSPHFSQLHMTNIS